MEVEFDDPKFQALVSSDRRMQKELGERRGKLVKRRLAALRAVDCVADLRNVAGNWHLLSTDRSEQWAADLDQPYRLVIRPTPPVPRLADGGVDWPEVSSVTVVEITDYH